MNKFEFVTKMLVEIEGAEHESSLLDVGCRTCDLKPYLNASYKYEGVDLFQNDSETVNHVLDITDGLPFDNKSYDYIVALDLLEHLDDIKIGLDEFCRVAKKAVIVMLPNMAHLYFRLRFLMNGRLSDKYDLTYGYGKDRHRWLTNIEQSDDYMKAYAMEHLLSIEISYFNDSPKKIVFERLGRLLGLSPNLWAWNSIYILKPIGDGCVTQ